MAYSPAKDCLLALVKTEPQLPRLIRWSVSSGQLVRHHNLPRRVGAVAVSKKSDLVAAYRDQVVTFYPFAENRLKRIDALPGLDVPVLAVSDDGLLFAMSRAQATAVGFDTHIEIHRRDSSRGQRLFRSSLNIRAMDFSPDGRFLGCAGSNGFTIWDTQWGESILAKPNREGFCIAFAPQQTVVAVGSGAYILVWDVIGGRQLRSSVGHQGPIRSLAFSPDGGILASGGLDRTVRFWDAHTGELLQTYDWQIGPVHAVAFAPDGLTCAAGGDSGEVVVWDVDV